MQSVPQYPSVLPFAAPRQALSPSGRHIRNVRNAHGNHRFFRGGVANVAATGRRPHQTTGLEAILQRRRDARLPRTRTAMQHDGRWFYVIVYWPDLSVLVADERLLLADHMSPLTTQNCRPDPSRKAVFGCCVALMAHGPDRCAGYSVCNEFAHGADPATVQRAKQEGRQVSWLNLALYFHAAHAQ